jgi:hypothetical protein
MEETSLSSKLTELNRNNLRLKLRHKIADKQLQRTKPSKKEINKQIDELNEFKKNKNVTNEIINLYYDAKLYVNKRFEIPKPNEIFDNEQHKLTYMSYLISLSKQIKNEITDKNLLVEEFKKLLNNPFDIYMSRCINIDNIFYRKLFEN